MIDMVGVSVIVNFQNLTVHLDFFLLLPFSAANSAHSVKRSPSAVDMPFVLGEAFVVFGVYDCVFAPRKLYPPEWVAVTEATIAEEKED
jgi:hypothetical protein